MKFPGFCGPSAENRSLNVNAERTINLYVEHPAGLPKSDPVLQGTPGIRPYCILDDTPMRALFHQDGRTFAVAGTTFYEILGASSFASRGTVANTATDDLVYICSNGRFGGQQLFIVSGGLGYIFALDTNAFTQITDPSFPANVTVGDFVDGYFVALNSQNNTFHLSDLEDGLSWDGTMVGERNLSSDEVIGMICVHREIWLLGAQRTEVWYNSGDTFPFRPILSAGVIESGLLAQNSLTRIDNSIMWLGADERGGAVAYRANGYQPERISTHAVEEAWRHYARPDLAVAWSYQEAGHQFYVLYFPQGPDPTTGVPYTHWVYDAAVGPQLGWHQRALWNSDTALWEPAIARCHCYDWVNNLHLVGDRQNGVIYTQSLDYFDEQIVLP